LPKTRRQRRKARARHAERLGMTIEHGQVFVAGKWRRFSRMVQSSWLKPGPHRGAPVLFPRQALVLVDVGIEGGVRTVMLDVSDPKNVKVWAAFTTEATVNPFTTTKTITGDPHG
jgi:hypothetical protein